MSRISRTTKLVEAWINLDSLDPVGRLLVFARVRTIVLARGWIQSFLHAGVSYEHNLMHLMNTILCIFGHVCVYL